MNDLGSRTAIQNVLAGFAAKPLAEVASECFDPRLRRIYFAIYAHDETDRLCVRIGQSASMAAQD